MITLSIGLAILATVVASLELRCHSHHCYLGTLTLTAGIIQNPSHNIPAPGSRHKDNGPSCAQ